MSSVPFTVKAIFDYTSDHEDDLVFSIGQIITVTEDEDEDWYTGTYTDDSGQTKEGIFPRNFVERYEPPRPAARPPKTKKQDTVSASRPIDPVPLGSSDEATSQKDTKPVPVVTGQPPEEKPETTEPLAPSVSSSSAAPVPKLATSPPAEAHHANISPTEADPKGQELPAERSAKKAPPPPSKSASSAFKNRIAAFNKPDSVPPASKPPNLNRFSHVPNVPQPQPQPVFPEGRQEPEKEERRVSQSQSSDDPVSPGNKNKEDEEEHQPITTLKERIALLQKQQLSQQGLPGLGLPKKEKPKKPAEKRRGSSVDEQAPVEAAPPSSAPEQPDNHKPQNIGYEHRESLDGRSDADSKDTKTIASTAQKGRSFEENEPSRPSTADDNQNLDKAEDGTEEKGVAEESDEESNGEELDPEIQRRIAIRERVARISGGVGMNAMFGAPPGFGAIPGAGHPKKAKSSSESSHRPSLEHDEPSPVPAPPVPLPGYELPRRTGVASKTEIEEQIEEETEDEPSRHVTAEETTSKVDSRRQSTDETSQAPSAPAAAPPVPIATRPLPSVPAEAPLSEKEVTSAAPHASGSINAEVDSDDEMSTMSFAEKAGQSDVGGTGIYNRSAPPPPPTLPSVPSTPSRRNSDNPSVMSPATKQPPAHRAPPPPPPNAPPLKPAIHTQTVPEDTETEDDATEYDGDYDTDLPVGAPHKNTLEETDYDPSDSKPHDFIPYQAKDARISEPTDRSRNIPRPPVPIVGPPQSPPSSIPPPPPPHNLPRAPPNPPLRRASSTSHASGTTNIPASTRGSLDNPPDVQSPTESQRMSFSRRPVPLTSREESESSATADDDSYNPAPPPPPHQAPPPTHHPRMSQYGPPAGPSSTTMSPSSPVSTPIMPRNPIRKSVDVSRTRRSMDVSRPDLGHIACDVDLAVNTAWWSSTKTSIPPVFQNRKDVHVEVDQASSPDDHTKTKIVFALFIDYSQTVITVQYDPRKPSAASIEQRHEPPPPQPRQDQLENAHEQFGVKIDEAVAKQANLVVGDGTPHALVNALLEPLKDALMPVGIRAYGALVYANLANASVKQSDEIRAGDIVTFRNAKFQGHRGTMHSKYYTSAGKPDHVGVVVDWDGTKKKIRAWEQGREHKKVKIESFRLDDLRSGECRVWRVMPRSWVGWDKLP